jgi:hypothetical protein
MVPLTDGAGDYAQILPDDGYLRCDAPATAEPTAPRCNARAILALEPFALCYDHQHLAGEMVEQWRRTGFLPADALDF